MRLAWKQILIVIFNLLKTFLTVWWFNIFLILLFLSLYFPPHPSYFLASAVKVYLSLSAFSQYTLRMVYLFHMCVCVYTIHEYIVHVAFSVNTEIARSRWTERGDRICFCPKKKKSNDNAVFVVSYFTCTKRWRQSHYRVDAARRIQCFRTSLSLRLRSCSSDSLHGWVAHPP